jgi:hypothetical protein
MNEDFASYICLFSGTADYCSKEDFVNGQLARIVDYLCVVALILAKALLSSANTSSHIIRSFISGNADASSKEDFVNKQHVRTVDYLFVVALTLAKSLLCNENIFT